MRAKRSQFIDEMGVPKTNLRKHYKCGHCSAEITRENFGISSAELLGVDEAGNLQWEHKVFCDACFLLPEVIRGERGEV